MIVKFGRECKTTNMPKNEIQVFHTFKRESIYFIFSRLSDGF